MRLIDLNEKISYNIKEYNLEDYYDKYVGLFFDQLKYNIVITDEQSDTFSIYDFINKVSSKKKTFILSLDEMYPDVSFKFIKEKAFKQYEQSKASKQKVLSFVLELSRFLTTAKHVKSFLDINKEMMNKYTFFKDGFICLNMTDLSQYIEEAKNITKDFNMVFEPVENKEGLYIKFPVERLFLLGYSTTDVSNLFNFLISTFKYVYALENCGNDFSKRFNLIEELNKWKGNIRQEVSDILKRMQ